MNGWLIRRLGLFFITGFYFTFTYRVEQSWRRVLFVLHWQIRYILHALDSCHRCLDGLSTVEEFWTNSYVFISAGPLTTVSVSRLNGWIPAVYCSTAPKVRLNWESGCLCPGGRKLTVLNPTKSKLIYMSVFAGKIWPLCSFWIYQGSINVTLR